MEKFHTAELAALKAAAAPSSKRGFKPAAGTGAAAGSAADGGSAASPVHINEGSSAHVDKRAKLQHGEFAASVASASRSSNSISGLFAAQRKGGATSALTRLLAVCSLPHNVVEYPEFSEFLTAVGWTERQPSRRVLAAERLQQAAQLRDSVGTKLAHSVVTIACDGWTNVQHNKVTNVVLIVNGVAYYWCSIVNAEERNTAEWMASALLPIFHTLIREWDARIAGFVVDNEAVNGSCFKLLRAELPFLLHIPCAAHTIQLIVHSTLQHHSFAGTVQQLHALIAFFAAKDNRNELRRVQRGLAVPLLNVVKPCETRWNSMLDAAKRMKKLQRAASACFTRVQLPIIDADFWEQLQTLISFLQPFADATDSVQSDAATLYTVYERFIAMQQHVLTLGHHWAAATIIARWHKNINAAAVSAAALMSFAVLPAALSQAKAQQFLLDWGTQYLFAYNLFPDGLIRRDIRDVLTEQLAEFNGRLGSFAGLDALKASLQRRAAADGQWQPKLLWLLFPHSELARVAVALLSISASEAAVERTFSAQAAVHSKLRNRMHDSSVQAEMFIKFNSRMLRLTPAADAFRRSGCVELKPCSDNADKNDESGSQSNSSDSEHSLLFSAKRVAASTAAAAAAGAKRSGSATAAAAVSSASNAGGPADMDETVSSAATDEDDDVVHRRLAAEEDAEEAAAAASAVQPSGAARRAARRAASIVFADVPAFITWFIAEHKLCSDSVINADLRNAVQRHSQSKLRSSNSPSTIELVKLIRAALI